MVADDLGDDEAEELLRELRVEPGVDGQGAEPGDLLGLARRVGRRQPVRRLEHADLLGDGETFREQVDQGGVHVVDAVPQPTQLCRHVLVHGGHA